MTNKDLQYTLEKSPDDFKIMVMMGDKAADAYQVSVSVEQKTIIIGGYE